MTPAVTTDPPKPVTRALLCGVAAGPLFVTVFVVEGTRRADYEPLRHPVGSLALGPWGWVQVVNFAVAGTLYLAAARGLSRTPDPLLGSRLGPMLFAATGVGLLGSAAFSTDPVSGYPPGTADLPTEQITRMKVHGIAAIPIFLGIPAAAFVYARRFHRSDKPTWALYSAATGVSMLATMGLAGAGFNQAPTLVDVAGLLQRAAIVTGFGWLTALPARSLRPSPRRSKGSAA
jgi:heme A synthase